MATRRQERINSRIVREISEVIREVKNGDLGFITITRADVSPDLRDAKIFFSVIGDETEIQRNLIILDRARGFIRSHLGKALQTRIVPQLEFMYDEQIVNSDQMNRLIREACADAPAKKDDDIIGDFPSMHEGLA